MRQYIRIYTLIFALLGCQQPSHNATLQISGFETQVRAFEQASNQVGKPVIVFDLIIHFNDTLQAQNQAGVCYGGTDTTTPRIDINTQWWATANDIQKEVLLFHELGHCILGRVHNDAYNSDHEPASIMNYTIAAFSSNYTQSYYETNKISYLQELFH